MTARATGASLDGAQKLRFRRMLWGFVNQGCTFVIVLGLYGFGMLPGERAAHFAVASLVINIGLVGALLSGFNLRLREPSMTVPQILLPVLPAIYTMYFVTSPQARMAFLLMAAGGSLFGMFALDRRRMLMLGGVIVLLYLAVVAALYQWAPQRVDLRAEAVIVFAYAAMLAIVAYLGSFIAGLRATLRSRNSDLRAAMARLEDLATRDALTRLPNRRSVMEQLAQEEARFWRRRPGNEALAIGVLDLDHFKRINDTWGHQAGDAVLRSVADALRQEIREGDFAGRFGGEEFIFILPETTPAGMRDSAERIRDAVARLRFNVLGDDEAVTASIGVAMHQPGESIEQTVKRADDALYVAKRGGRDRVVIADAHDAAVARAAERSARGPGGGGR